MKIFVSYPSEKEHKAREIYDFVRTMGIDQIWFDKTKLVGGQDWDREIEVGLKDSDLVILVCSAEIIIKSGIIQKEIKKIIELSKNQPLGAIFLIPIRIEDISLPEDISKYQYIDSFRDDWRFRLSTSILSKFQQSKLSPPAQLEEYVARQENFRGIETKHIEFNSRKISASADFYIYKEPNDYLEYINSEIIKDVFGDFYRAKAEGFLWEGARDSEIPREWSLQVDEFFKEGDLISLKFFSWSFFGGAHPNRGIYTKNFSGDMFGRIDLDDFFDRDQKIFSFLKRYSELEIKKQLIAVSDIDENHSDYALPDWGDYVTVDRWILFSQWSFNKSGLVLNFSEHSGLPYVMGVFEVTVPWNYVVDHISPKYKDSPMAEFVRRNV